MSHSAPGSLNKYSRSLIKCYYQLARYGKVKMKHPSAQGFIFCFDETHAQTQSWELSTSVKQSKTRGNIEAGHVIRHTETHENKLRSIVDLNFKSCLCVSGGQIGKRLCGLRFHRGVGSLVTSGQRDERVDPYFHFQNDPA